MEIVCFLVSYSWWICLVRRELGSCCCKLGIKLRCHSIS